MVDDLENTSHYVQLEAPEAVIAAVRDVVTAVRGGVPLESQESGPGQKGEPADESAPGDDGI